MQASCSQVPPVSAGRPHCADGSGWSIPWGPGAWGKPPSWGSPSSTFDTPGYASSGAVCDGETGWPMEQSGRHSRVYREPTCHVDKKSKRMVMCQAGTSRAHLSSGRGKCMASTPLQTTHVAISSLSPAPAHALQVLSQNRLRWSQTACHVPQSSTTAAAPGG